MARVDGSPCTRCTEAQRRPRPEGRWNRKGTEDCGHWRQGSQAIDSEPLPRPGPFSILWRTPLAGPPPPKSPYPKPNSHPATPQNSGSHKIPPHLSVRAVMVSSVAEAGLEHQLAFGPPCAPEQHGPGSQTHRRSQSPVAWHACGSAEVTAWTAPTYECAEKRGPSTGAGGGAPSTPHNHHIQMTKSNNSFRRVGLRSVAATSPPPRVLVQTPVFWASLLRCRLLVHISPSVAAVVALGGDRRAAVRGGGGAAVSSPGWRRGDDAGGAAGAARRWDADDLRCVRERAGGALLRGRRGRALPALRREGDLRSPLSSSPLADRAGALLYWMGTCPDGCSNWSSGR
jgi:hypothetical protein